MRFDLKTVGRQRGEVVRTGFAGGWMHVGGWYESLIEGESEGAQMQKQETQRVSIHRSASDQRSASSRNPTLWRGLLYSFQHARTLRVRATLVADLSGTLQPADRMVVVGEAGEEREAEGPLSLELCKVGQGRRSCACRYVPRTQCICQWWESCWLCTVTSNIRLWPWLRVLVRSSIEPSLFAGE
jgi:hypothetical protein